MTLFYIRTNDTTLLRSRLLRYSLWWCTVQRHLHSLRPLVRVRLGGTGRRWRKILWWRIGVLVQRRGFRPCAVLPLCVLWVGCVGVLCLVKGEVVLGDLAMAATFRVGYQKLLHCLLVFDGVVDTEGGRGVDVRDGIRAVEGPFLTFALRGYDLLRTIRRRAGRARPCPNAPVDAPASAGPRRGCGRLQ